MKPITIYWRDIVPNPSKVLIIMEELGLPYESIYVELEDLKKEPFEKVNPNGRVPAINDPNTGITLFESGAIVEYLIQTYDKSHLLSYADAPKKFETIQWSYYQASGQGPYFGQAAWFNLFHPEKLESAQARYGNEIKRVAGVLDKVLAGKQWLVGDKCTYADLAFVMWNTNIAYVMNGRPEGWDIEQFPNFKKWQEAMLARDSVKKVLSVLMDKEVKSAGRV